jgi:hypothetical protein
MAQGTLVLHRGAREVSVEELTRVDAPAATKTWFPLKHARVLEIALGTLEGAGYQVERMRLALSADNAKFFGVVDLKTQLVEGVSLACGVRNSINRTFPIGFCAGSRVFVCDNLAFRSELMVRRKHSRFGHRRFANDIAAAVSALGSWKDQEAQRIQRLQETPLTEERAESCILRAYLAQIVSNRHLPRVVNEWTHPSFQEFTPRTAWSLLNAFTTVLGEMAAKNPNEYAGRTMRLHQLLYPPVPSDGVSIPAGGNGLALSA